MGGALGLAVLASLAPPAPTACSRAGERRGRALNGGYHAAFLAGAVFAVAAAIVGAVGFRAAAPVHEGEVPAAIPVGAEGD